MKIDFSNLFKIRIANSDESFQKHEVVKLLIVMKLLNKYKHNRSWIYTEFKLENGNKTDIYFEDLKNKDVYIYEIQKSYTKKWLEKKTDQYDSYEVPFMKSVNFIPINLKELSTDILELNRELEKYIY